MGSEMCIRDRCHGDLRVLGDSLGVPVDRGPKDLYDLPAYLGGESRRDVSLESYSIEILAEINHASRLGEAELMAEALLLSGSGADVIDLGMVPGESWPEVESATRQLVAAGLRVSIDSFDRTEVEAAIAGGAELVLSCDTSNLDWLSPLAADSGTAVAVSYTHLTLPTILLV